MLLAAGGAVVLLLSCGGGGVFLNLTNQILRLSFLALTTQLPCGELFKVCRLSAGQTGGETAMGHRRHLDGGDGAAANSPPPRLIRPCPHPVSGVLNRSSHLHRTAIPF